MVGATGFEPATLRPPVGQTDPQDRETTENPQNGEADVDDRLSSLGARGQSWGNPETPRGRMIAALAAEIAGAFEAGNVAAVRVAIEAIRLLVEVPRGTVVELAIARKRNDSGR